MQVSIVPLALGQLVLVRSMVRRFVLCGAPRVVAVLLFSFSCQLTPPALAQSQPSPAAAMSAAEQREAEIKSAWTAASKVGQRGPLPVALLGQATIDLPRGMVFVPQPEAGQLLRAFGNRPGDNLAGLVVPTNDDDWTVVIRFVKEGFVKDDDAKDWNAADLLASLKEGTEEANKERVQRGFPELEIIGWLREPSYDAQAHRLVWSLASKNRGAPDNAVRGVNYNTYALGRDGYFSLNLITTVPRLDADRQVAATLLSNLEYDAGKRYDDFNASTDRVAEYGLAALIGVVAAKKLGLFAIIAAFALKFAKVGLLALAAIGAGFFKFFRRKPKPDPAA